SWWLPVVFGILAFGLGFYILQGGATPSPATRETAASDNGGGTELLTPDEQEREANERLAAVRLWAEEGLDEVARRGGQEIVRDYPTTSAATVAKRVLEELQKLAGQQASTGRRPDAAGAPEDQELAWVLIEQEEPSPGEPTLAGSNWKLAAEGDDSREMVILR